MIGTPCFLTLLLLFLFPTLLALEFRQKPYLQQAASIYSRVSPSPHVHKAILALLIQHRTFYRRWTAGPQRYRPFVCADSICITQAAPPFRLSAKETLILAISVPLAAVAGAAAALAAIVVNSASAVRAPAASKASPFYTSGTHARGQAAAGFPIVASTN